jgi:DNA-binding response OmpR family regulator
MIKSQEATQHIDVIAITAYPESESEKKILDCGARKCFNKPLDMEQLLKEIEACVE